MNATQKVSGRAKRSAMRKRYYTANEFGELTGFTGHTIRKFCRTGELDHIRLGSKIRIPETALHSLEGGAQ